MTTTEPIYKQIKLNLFNTLTVEIEPNFNDTFSIVAYDEDGEVWKEKFANTYLLAVVVAQELIKSILKQYKTT